MTSVENFIAWVPVPVAFISLFGSYWALYRVKNYVTIQPETRQLYVKLWMMLVMDALVCKQDFFSN
jgi:hypothetical protein